MQEEEPKEKEKERKKEKRKKKNRKISRPDLTGFLLYLYCGRKETNVHFSKF